MFNFLHHKLVFISITYCTRILLQIVFLNVFSVLCVALITVHISQPYVNVSLIVDMYNLTFGRLEKSFDLEKKALIKQRMLSPILLFSPLFHGTTNHCSYLGIETNSLLSNNNNNKTPFKHTCSGVQRTSVQPSEPLDPVRRTWTPHQ